MQYAYAQVPLDRPGEPSNWHAFNEPGTDGYAAGGRPCSIARAM